MQQRSDLLIRRFRVASLLLVAAVVVGRTAYPEEPATLEGLQSRVEAIERENRELRRALTRKKSLDAARESDEGAIIQVDDNEPFSDEALANDERIRESIRSHLTSQKADDPATGKVLEWYEIGSDAKLSASWRNGLEIESKNHDFRVHIGGRTQFDVGWFRPDDSVNNSLPITNKFRDGVDFRRARFRIDGVMYETMEWAAEFDFVNSAGAGAAGAPISVVAPTDLWWQWNEIPFLQHFRVGNQKEPIGFEHLTSSRYLNFMERSFMQDAFFGGFNNGFTPGAQFFGSMADDRMTYNIGVFDPTTNVFGTNVGPSEYSFTGRLTALPYYVDEGRSLLHLGFSARHWSLDEHQARFRTRASVRAGPSTQWPIIADTGLVTGDTNQQVNVELMAQLGPFSVISEFLTSWLQKAQRPNGTIAGTAVYRGVYVEALYFITGEHRNYNRGTGVIDRVIPAENAFFARGDGDEGPAFGWGGWQIAARYQMLDLNSIGINGGILHDTTLGINWYLNPNFKVQANYMFTYREAAAAGTGSVQGFGIRLAHDF